ncbi:MAG: histidinol-phosphate transaminase [Alphaproteobacteria bacterium]|nr:MAG: histidinol-phosphate transaminase [Alphaproteobacteria bacterium]
MIILSLLIPMSDTKNDAIFKHIRDHYKTMEGYSSAGMLSGKDAAKTYLNANENPYPLPGLEELNRYPEPQPPTLLEAYAQTYGVEHTQVAMTRGADEALVVLTKTFCEPHKDQILISSPAFGMYAVDAQAMPSGVIDVPLIKADGTFTLDHEEIVKQAKAPENHIKLVFICSPNNPTGGSFSHELISEICEALEGHAVVILDEAYAEFSKAGSMTADLDSTPNLIILRTLSKAYSFAGMRMGCMLCGNENFISLIRTKVLDAYPLPRMSIEAAFHVLSPDLKPIVEENIQKILAERNRINEVLEQSDKITHIYPSDANFLLIEMDKAKEFCAFTAENNVILRDFSSQKGTENCLRLTIGTPEENDMVLDLLEKFEA